MAIVDDYAGVAAEVRRIHAERAATSRQPERPRHPSRTISIGEQVYWRLVPHVRKAARSQ
jgi:hypothetical protein